MYIYEATLQVTSYFYIYSYLSPSDCTVTQLVNFVCCTLNVHGPLTSQNLEISSAILTEQPALQDSKKRRRIVLDK